MNTNLVNSAAGVINAALTQNRTAAGIALALESAQMLMTPETAAELEKARLRVDEVERKYTFDTAELKRQLDSARVDGQRLRAERAEVGNEIARFGIYGAALPAAKALVKRADELVTENAQLRARVAELEAERHSTNEALDDAVQELRMSYAERAQRETHPGRRQAWRMLAQAEESERVANALLTAEAARSADKLTALLAPTQALREDGACTECGDAPSSWCPGCAKCSCVPEHDMGCTGVMGGAR